jgi:three-Cys-motif partner protein
MPPYVDREQTQAKHFILKRYLQALAFKVLRHWDIAYVDGFSGPWKSETTDFADTSFMIAIQVLKDAQDRIHDQTGGTRKIKCFFSESDPPTYAQLEAAVAPHNQPLAGFEVRAFPGKFEDAVSDIRSSSAPLSRSSSSIRRVGPGIRLRKSRRCSSHRSAK